MFQCIYTDKCKTHIHYVIAQLLQCVCAYISRPITCGKIQNTMGKLSTVEDTVFYLLE